MTEISNQIYQKRIQDIAQIKNLSVISPERNPDEIINTKSLNLKINNKNIESPASTKSSNETSRRNSYSRNKDPRLKNGYSPAHSLTRNPSKTIINVDSGNLKILKKHNNIIIFDYFLRPNNF